MKHCPACNFSFPDFHRVCDFDGTELVSDPQRPSLVKASAGPSGFRRILKSPILLTSLSILALFSSAVLIGYVESANKPSPLVPPVVKAPPSPPSLSVARASKQPPAQVKTPIPSKRDSIRTLNKSPGSTSASRRRQGQATAARTLARLPQKTSIETRSQKSEIARQTEPQQVSNEKQPKLVSILKTTWHVLKKPFKF
jgi:hypothetical protein